MNDFVVCKKMCQISTRKEQKTSNNHKQQQHKKVCSSMYNKYKRPECAFSALHRWSFFISEYLSILWRLLTSKQQTKKALFYPPWWYYIKKNMNRVLRVQKYIYLFLFYTFKILLYFFSFYVHYKHSRK